MKKASRIMVALTLVFSLIMLGLFLYEYFYHAGMYVTTESGLRITHDSAIGSIQPLNINTAPLEDLCLLPGIGEKTAQMILDYREEHGPFRSVDDLLNISGILKSDLEAFRHLITVGG